MSDLVHMAILSKGLKINKKGGGEFSLPEFINKVQGFALGLRLTHWETTSYELHKAVEMTEESLLASLDAFVEACIGSMEGKRPTLLGVVTKELDPDVLLDYLSSLECKETDLLNIRDEMLAAVHKFKYLKTLT